MNRKNFCIVGVLLLVALTFSACQSAPTTAALPSTGAPTSSSMSTPIDTSNLSDTTVDLDAPITFPTYDYSMTADKPITPPTASTPLYTLSATGGKAYLTLTEQSAPPSADDSEWSSGLVPLRALHFSSAAEMKSALLTGKLDEKQQETLKSFAADSQTGQVEFFNLNQLYEPKLGIGEVLGVSCTNNSYCYPVMMSELRENFQFSFFILSQTAFEVNLKQAFGLGAVTVYDRKTVTDRNAEELYFTNSSNQDVKWVMYSLTGENGTCIVLESYLRDDTGEFTDLKSCQLYGASNIGVFWALLINKPSRRLTLDEIAAFGVQPFAGNGDSDSTVRPDVPITIPPVTITPPSTTKAPETTKAPPVTTQTPPVTTKAPPVTTKAPPVTTEKPIVTTEKPIVTPDPSAPTICIDPGHGFEDPGALGELYGVTYYEKNINMAISLQLKDALMRLGYNVIFTHDGVTLPSSTYLGSSSPRYNVNKRNKWISDRKSQIDLVLSVHCNSYPDKPSVSGSRYYIIPYGKVGYTAKSEPLCTAIRNAVKTGLGLSTAPKQYTLEHAVLQTGIPSVLLECGFLTNETDLKNLLSSTWQKKYAAAVAKGVDTYLKNT